MCITTDLQTPERVRSRSSHLPRTRPQCMVLVQDFLWSVLPTASASNRAHAAAWTLTSWRSFLSSELRSGENSMGRVLNAIVAVCPGMGIGKDGSLPWPMLRNEFKYFQKMTMTSTKEGKENAVIMGRKTWLSIPEKNRPLKGRINIVLSRELTEPPQGAHYLAHSLDEALQLLESPELAEKLDMLWIIGGSSLYKELMAKSHHQRLFVTRILKEFDCDTFLPEIDLEKYKLLPEYPGVSAEVQEENGVQYKFEVYEKTEEA